MQAALRPGVSLASVGRLDLIAFKGVQSIAIAVRLLSEVIARADPFSIATASRRPCDAISSQRYRSRNEQFSFIHLSVERASQSQLIGHIYRRKQVNQTDKLPTGDVISRYTVARLATGITYY